MINKLTSNNLDEAINVYIKGMNMQIPPGGANVEYAQKKLNENECFIYKKDSKILGLVTFEQDKNTFNIKFICAITPKKGIGSALMKYLALTAKEI